ncbi:MAG: alpha/beta hydrolase [Candidatus Tectomicrobia bacterium]|nr:alpha/beta hydrolase [Candidatus Tectomicrobia bacterium]
MTRSELLIDGPTDSPRVYVFAHGAGAPMDTDWMNTVASLLAKREIKVIRFEFSYMAARRLDGRKRPPNRATRLQATWREVIDLAGDPQEMYIGGKSMGGRQASLIADELEIKGLICLGFPFHAPGKAPGDRIEHLKSLKTPTLICQGTRDSMGMQAEVAGYALSQSIQLSWLEDGDHAFKPRVKSGYTLAGHLQHVVDQIDVFISGGR